jgi:hypothetical protein
MSHRAKQSSVRESAEQEPGGRERRPGIPSRLASIVGNRALGRLVRGGSAVEPIRAAVATSGEPLNPVVQAAMEEELGAELGDVRIHRDAQAERAAEAANATAFTVGEHVVFGRGAYDPSRERGRQVLAHELAHVLQGSQPGSLGVVPPTAAAEQQAQRGAGSTDAATTGVARIVKKDLTQLDDAGLQSEYDLALQWVQDHPTGDQHEVGVQYLDQITQLLLKTSPNASTPASPAPSTSTPASPSPHANTSDEALAEASRQGDTEAADEIFTRARSSPGYEPPPAGSEEWSPDETYPDFIGPERSPFRSRFTALNEGDIERYGAFNTPARSGDQLAGHEVLQNAWLKRTGLSQRRGTGPVSRGNPSLAVSEDLHLRISAGQQQLGLNDPQRLAQMTDQEVIDENVRALEQAGVERSQIEMMRREATQYAAELRARAAPAPSGTPASPAASPPGAAPAPTPAPAEAPPATEPPTPDPIPPELLGDKPLFGESPQAPPPEPMPWAPAPSGGAPPGTITMDPAPKGPKAAGWAILVYIGIKVAIWGITGFLSGKGGEPPKGYDLSRDPEKLAVSRHSVRKVVEQSHFSRFRNEDEQRVEFVRRYLRYLEEHPQPTDQYEGKVVEAVLYLRELEARARR